MICTLSGTAQNPYTPATIGISFRPDAIDGAMGLSGRHVYSGALYDARSFSSIVPLVYKLT